MFTPKSRTRVSLGKVQTPLLNSASRRKSTLYTPKNKSFFSPSSGKNKSLNVSDFPLSFDEGQSSDHVLGEFGGPIPLLVTETLTRAERGSPISVKLGASGWAWLVYKQKLIVWNYISTKGNICHELVLPQSDESIAADLVTVFNSSDGGAVSCMVVTLEGVVRFWSCISYTGSYIETNIALKGFEVCASIVPLQFLGCVVGTTASTLVLVTLFQGQLRSRILKPQQGMLTGIGRRVSSIFFGGSSQQQTIGSPLRKLLAGETLSSSSQAVYVLTESSLQKWSAGPDSERMIFEMNLEALLRDNLAKTVWNKDADQLSELTCHLMDVQLVSDGVAILGSGTNLESSRDVYYALGTLHTPVDEAPISFLSFTIIGYRAIQENDGSFPQFQFLWPDLTSTNVYLYNSDSIVCIKEGQASEQLSEVVNFPNFGAGCYNGMPAFFSKQGCIVKVQETVAAINISVADSLLKNRSFARLDTSIAVSANTSRIVELSQSQDKLARLKAAFLANICDGPSQTQATSIVNSLFPPNQPTEVGPGSLLDTLVTSLSREMVDDYPASDPRWAESLPSDATSTSVSLILIHQLDDKMKAHELYLNFLKTVGLWDKLTTIKVRDTVISTNMLLCEHAEKLEAAKILRELHTEFPQLVDRVIEICLNRRKLGVTPRGLTPQDLFYREVSNVHEILESLVGFEEALINGNLSPHDTVELVTRVNTIVKSMLSRATQYRQAKSSVYRSKNPSSDMKEFVPWTATSGVNGSRTILTKQHSVTVEKALPEAKDNQERGALFQQLLELTDLILDGYRVQLDSMRASNTDPRFVDVFRKYERDRSNLLAPFVKHGQYERATSLAEKYCDFSTLVQLCEELNNQDRLKFYIDKFQAQGFSDFVFKWYTNEGKRGKLLSSDLSSNPTLGAFLQSKENQFMSWVHDVGAKNFYKAHDSLWQLAKEETDFVGKKKTLLSLSKLAALAECDPPDNIQDTLEVIDNNLDLIQHQEQLLSYQEVREHLAIEDTDNMKAFTAVELIDLYIGDYNVNANEFDFKKALDLLHYVDKEDRDHPWRDILIDIWVKAILRDRWDRPPSASDPIESCKDTLFYRTLDLASTEGTNIDEYLPGVDELLESSDLHHLGARKDFECLLRAIYEHIYRSHDHAIDSD